MFCALFYMSITLQQKKLKKRTKKHVNEYLTVYLFELQGNKFLKSCPTSSAMNNLFQTCSLRF